MNRGAFPRAFRVWLQWRGKSHSSTVKISRYPTKLQLIFHCLEKRPKLGSRAILLAGQAREYWGEESSPISKFTNLYFAGKRVFLFQQTKNRKDIMHKFRRSLEEELKMIEQSKCRKWEEQSVPISLTKKRIGHKIS